MPAPGISGEQLDRMNGWLEVMWSDGQAVSDPAPPPLFLLTKDDGTTVTLTIDEEVLRQAGGVFAVNRRQVSLSGSWQNDASGAPRGFEVQSVMPQRMRGAEAAPGGSQAWISILCKFSDSVSEPRALSYFHNMYADSYPGLGHCWREQSYDLVDLTGSSAAGWFTLPQPRSITSMTCTSTASSTSTSSKPPGTAPRPPIRPCTSPATPAST